MNTDFDALILNEAPGGIVVTTQKRIVVHWTKGAEIIFGYTSAEAIGSLLDELISLPGRHDHGANMLQELLDKGTCDYECLRRRKDGSVIYVDVSSKAIFNPQGQIEFILSSKKDVTQLKALRDAKLIEAKYRDLLESTPDGIVIANLTGRIVLANTQAEKLFGYAREELLGQGIEVLIPAPFRDHHPARRSLTNLRAARFSGQ